jgi:hypothetical protein
MLGSVRERITIRDKNQFEIKYTYPLQLDQENTEYVVETFIFLPTNLPFNSKDYRKENFYRDNTAYIRFKTPAFMLPEIICGNDSPLAKTHAAISRLIETPEEPEAVENYNYRLRMFCSILKSALRDEVERIENIHDPLLRGEEAIMMVDSLSRIQDELRLLHDIPGFNTLDSEKRAMFSFSDEYTGIVAEHHLFKLLKLLNRDNQAEQAELRSRIVEQIEAGNSYRFSAGYPTIVRENSTNETFIYRMRMLKKIMGSILYIRTENIDDGKWAEQFAINIAAGLAMALATVVLLFAQTFNQSGLGWWVIFTAVVAYIIRERMKESSRSFFVEWIRSHYYDYKTILRDDLDRKIGESKSFMSFLKQSKIPRKIQAARDKDLISTLLSDGYDEEVIYAKKRITIHNDSCRTIWSDFKVDGINDIVRYNMSAFMKKMNQPERDLFILGDNGWKTVEGTGVYHFNMILRYGMGGNSEIHKFRLIMNRNGIQRIIEVPVKQ